MLNAANACFARIQSFLISDARRDHRLPLSPTPNLIEGYELAAETQGIELEETSPKASELSPISVLLDVRNASFAWYVNFLRAVVVQRYEQWRCLRACPSNSTP